MSVRACVPVHVGLPTKFSVKLALSCKVPASCLPQRPKDLIEGQGVWGRASWMRGMGCYPELVVPMLTQSAPKHS